MKKWWIGAAVAAMCVGEAAWGQGPQAGSALLPEPAPVAPCPPQGPQMTPGPLNGSMAPPAPGDALTLPADVPTAWGKGPLPESGFYLSLGAMGLQRQRPGHAPIAESDATGDFMLNTHDISPGPQWGGRATAGYLCDDAAIEVTGFYLPYHTSSATASEPTGLTLFFQNAPGGFAGFPTTSANLVQASLRTMLGNAELNYRWWSRSQTGLEGIIGFRYLELQETARLFGDANPIEDASLLDPTLQATYQAAVRNHMLLPQIGCEWDLALAKYLQLGVIAKAAFGADYYDVVTRLTRGDGVVGLQGERHGWTYSSVWELDAFFDLVMLEKMKIRAGYTALWALHVAEGLQQIDYDLSSQPGGRHDGGSVFYHGPMLEVEFLF